MESRPDPRSVRPNRPPREANLEARVLDLADLGHFALTGLLLGHLGGADPRVVIVTSLQRRPGRIDFDDLGWGRGYDPRAAYQRSKLANAAFGIEPDRRLRAAGSPVKSVLAHPAIRRATSRARVPPG